MNDLARPHSDPPGYAPQIVVIIVRTGGIAGIRRQWQVEPPLDENPRWAALIEQCPWDAPNQEPHGADRYIWSIRAHTPADSRERDVPDHDLAGPWRDLVDAVRNASQEDGDADD
ncbi:MAG TPA: hypothetical protein DIW46_11230 [Microbacterium sp.]|uniref:protealysin inhibitor emfourin n=1 Tax=Microbacterium sp. TaxID=51671 RepID=UPI000EE44D33|nr:hypothetical protein [Microbacterium sp.]